MARFIFSAERAVHAFAHNRHEAWWIVSHRVSEWRSDDAGNGVNILFELGGAHDSPWHSNDNEAKGSFSVDFLSRAPHPYCRGLFALLNLSALSAGLRAVDDVLHGSLSQPRGRSNPEGTQLCSHMQPVTLFILTIFSIFATQSSTLHSVSNSTTPETQEQVPRAKRSFSTVDGLLGIPPALPEEEVHEFGKYEWVLAHEEAQEESPFKPARRSTSSIKKPNARSNARSSHEHS